MILCFYNIIKSHILVDTGGGVILFNFELGSISPNLLNLNKPLFDNNRKTPLRLILSKTSNSKQIGVRNIITLSIYSIDL